MTNAEWEDYEKRIKEFFSHGLQNLSIKPDNEPFFSWKPCECCGNNLGGDRYECNGYNAITKEVEEYDCICSDCIYCGEYGRLDDSAMNKIEDSKE